MDDMVFSVGTYEVFSWDDLLELSNDDLMQFQDLKSKIASVRKKKGIDHERFAVKKISEEKFNKLLEKNNK